jgi:Cu(I)/Ag(I) efflux system membrane fusion protein
MLVPKYADEGGGEVAVSIDPRVMQNLGVRIAEARSGSLTPKLTAVGSVEYDEAGVVLIHAHVPGYVERLYVRAPLAMVQNGQPLVQLLAPEMTAAQEEFLLAAKLGDEGAAIKFAARTRLILLGMTGKEVTEMERMGRPDSRMTLRAPMSGVVAEMNVRSGMAVTTGMTLFRIVDLSTVWVYAEVPEAQAGWLRPGGQVAAHVPTWPGETFHGSVVAILPEVNVQSRTVRARIVLDNPDAKLKPGMFASLEFVTPKGRRAVLVPSEAVIRTGERSVVIVADGEGKFRAVDVKVGAESGGDAEIREGLRAGDKVVVSGQFLIDSEASLRGTLARLQSTGQPAGAPVKASLHRGTGRVTNVDSAQGRIELDHGQIASLKWPPMKMGFAVENKALLTGLKQGDAVEFELRGEPNKNGDYVLTRIAPAKQGPTK